MASRVIEAGTVVARVRQLLSCGVLKERPLWLDVVERFPPLTTPQYNRKPEPGRPLTLWYQQDRLIKYFEETYEVIKQGKPFNIRPAISLFEDRRGNDKELLLSFVEEIIKEQMRLMAEGKSKADALTGAIATASEQHKDMFVRPKISPYDDLDPEACDTTTQLDRTISDINKILSSQ